jgi:hypothetical protein
MPDQPAGYGLRELVNTANLHAVFFIALVVLDNLLPQVSLNINARSDAGDGLRKSRVAMRRR